MNPLCLPDTEYRAVFERISGLALEYLESLNDRPNFPDTSGSKTQALFCKSLPEQGFGEAALGELQAVIGGARACGPRFFGYVMGSGEPIAAAADLLASVLNQNVTAWRSSPAAVTLEHVVVGWLAEAIGCPGFRGSLTGGGSSANLMALAMARESRLPGNENGVRVGTVYASEQVHMSIPKAVALLGLGRANLRLLGCDDQFRVRPDLLREAIASDVSNGVTPIAVIASAGTVNTGSIDPLLEISNIAREFGAWLHVDGAYGALAAIAEPAKFAGLDQADSISLDPHKWLYQPLDCGCLLYRHAEDAQRAFSHTGDYAKSLIDDPIEGFAFFDESIELSRRFRALKLWLSLRYHGLANFRNAIRNDLAMAQHLSALIGREPQLELLAPVQLSAVCFRYIPQNNDDSDALNQAILQRVIRRGKVYLSNASIHERFALRACIVNHRTTRGDVEQVVTEVLAAAREVEAGGRA